MPLVKKIGAYEFRFYSRGEAGEPAHIHVRQGRLEAKFWLTPSVHLAKNVGLSVLQLRQAKAVVEAHTQEIQDAWNRHFGG